MNRQQRGATLAIGLILLALVLLLALAAANAAHVERLLAQNQWFRENAATAASAGIEMAIRAIVSSPDPASTPTHLVGQMPGSNDHYEVELRFAGLEQSLPQLPATRVSGAHFDIVSTGRSARNITDRQRVSVLWTVEDPAGTLQADCEPIVPRHCHARGELERLSWQRLPAE
jgi:Tfp pilus assembly protein PilX